MLALSFGLWLVLAPSLWEFPDGLDTGLVPIAPTAVLEPTQAAIARAQWNSILAGLLTLTLATTALAATHHKKRRPTSTPTEHSPQVEAADEPR